MVYCHFMLVVLACVATLGCCADDKKKSPELTVTHEAWFVVEIQDHRDRGDDYVGTFVIGLFGREVPITVLNFVQLTRGYTSKEGMRSQKLGYKNTVFHKVVRDFTIQGGDVTVGDGTGGKSIFGESFDDESFHISHKAAGYVSMANHGKDTNASQFIILLNKARWLDGQHVVFGKIIKGMDVVQAIGEVDVVEETGKPKMKIKIVDCGINELDTKYTLTEKEATSDEDIERDVEIY